MLVKLAQTIGALLLFASAILCGRMRMAANQGRREVTMGEIQCPRCEETFITEWHEVRFRAGSFYDAERDESFEQLCEDCHREVTNK